MDTNKPKLITLISKSRILPMPIGVTEDEAFKLANMLCPTLGWIEVLIEGELAGGVYP